MSRNVLLSVMLVAATGLLGGCDSLDVLNPFSPDKVDLQPLFAEPVPNQTWTVGTAVHLSLPAASEGNPPLTYGPRRSSPPDSRSMPARGPSPARRPPFCR